MDFGPGGKTYPQNDIDSISLVNLWVETKSLLSRMTLQIGVIRKQASEELEKYLRCRLGIPIDPCLFERAPSETERIFFADILAGFRFNNTVGLQPSKPLLSNG